MHRTGKLKSCFTCQKCQLYSVKINLRTSKDCMEDDVGSKRRKKAGSRTSRKYLLDSFGSRFFKIDTLAKKMKKRGYCWREDRRDRQREERAITGEEIYKFKFKTSS